MAISNICSIKTNIDENILSAEILPAGGIFAGDEFYTYLLKNEQICFRDTEWRSSPTFEWTLSESGVYCIQYHLRRGGVNTMSYSPPLLFMTTDDECSFQQYLSREDECADEYALEIDEKNVFLSSTPYTDFIFLNYNGPTPCKNKIISVAKRFGLECFFDFYADNSCIVCNKARLKENDNQSFIFSGSCFTSTSLIFGDHKISDLKAIIREEPVGDYSYILYDKYLKTISVGTDYFGVSKLFCLQTDDIVICGNNYHLLLLIACEIGVSLDIDRIKAEASLVFSRLQPFHQAFTCDMNVAPIKMLPPTKVLHFTNSSFNLHDTSLADSLESPLPFEISGYKQLLIAAKSEILRNLRSILEYPEFENIIMDLSGGLDSRITFSALTHFPEYSHKIKINCLDTPGQPNDLATALQLVSFYEYDFDDLPRRRIFDEQVKYMAWSYNLGLYYSYCPLTSKDVLPPVARVTGFYGEICARPYYSRKYFHSMFDVSSIEEFCHLYISHYRKTMIVPSSLSADGLQRLFREELEKIPGRTALEKFDTHYLFFRNGLHCSSRLRGSLGCPEFGPILSKSLFFAKRMAFHEFNSAKVQFDIISLLNPLLSCVNYESDFDNKDQESIFKVQGSFVEPWMKKVCVRQGDRERILGNWQKANEKRAPQRIFVDAKSGELLAQPYQKFDAVHFNWVLGLIKKLKEEQVLLSESLLRSLWLMLSRRGEVLFSRTERWNIANRIISLYIQMRLVVRAKRSLKESSDAHL